MIRAILLVVALFMLVGCGRPRLMSRVEVIAAVKECEAAGMVAEVLYNGWNYDTHDVRCMPKESK